MLKFLNVVLLWHDRSYSRFSFEVFENFELPSKVFFFNDHFLPQRFMLTLERPKLLGRTPFRDLAEFHSLRPPSVENFGETVTMLLFECCDEFLESFPND